MNIPGVPDSITREQMRKALRELGIDPRECCGLEWRAHARAVHVTVYGSPEAGKESGSFVRYFAGGPDDQVAKHSITVPLVET